VKPRLLDLFCGAGGAARGYQMAGFYITGVDIRPQPRYCGDAFHQADALEFLAEHGADFDVIHASPPCQAYSVCSVLPQCDREYPNLLAPTRELLIAAGRPFIIENVVGAPFLHWGQLCGEMFGLPLFRHRRFESNICLLYPVHERHRGRIGFNGYCCVAGHGDGGRRTRVAADHRTKAAWERSMGIDWMSKYELSQAIPPAYAEYVGRQLYEAAR
jgi:C-5 cytosine-specific DNA methylase